MKRIIALICGLILILSMTACKSKRENSDNLLGVNAGEDNEVAVKVNIPQFDIPDSLPELSVEKIGSFDDRHIKTSLKATSSGIIYRGEDDRWGIITLDGKHDTGAIYYDLQVEGDYFAVVIDEPTGDKWYNYYSLVDAEGNVLIPGKYFRIDEGCGHGSDRYYMAYNVNAVADSEDGGIVSSFRNTYAEKSYSDREFNGTWYIYDTVTGKMVDGVHSNTLENFDIRGNVIIYTDENGELHYVDENGDELEHRFYRENGTYFSDDYSTVYNCYGEKLFSVGADIYSVLDFKDGYYYVYRRTPDFEDPIYYLLNEKGEVASAEFYGGGLLTVHGSIIEQDKKLYTFDGTPILESEVTEIYEHEFAPGFYYVYTPDTDSVSLITADGKVYMQGTDLIREPGLADYFIARKYIGDKGDRAVYSYSFKDGDFTLSGGVCSCWTIMNTYYDDDREYHCDIIDTISGNVLISASSSFCSSAVAKDGTGYIYANMGNAYDVYVLKVE